MGRKKNIQAVAEYDENGNLLPVDENLREVEIIDNSDETALEVMTAMMLISRDGNTEYLPGEWGDKPFTTHQINLSCERMGIEVTSSTVSSIVRKMFNAGVLFKSQGRKVYQYNRLYGQKAENWNAELEAMRANRPI